jgi:hypothetical protein
MNVFSLAFSVRAACADCMALDVLGREVRLGEDGFIGSGGGARSGSELSHLAPDSAYQFCLRGITTYIGTIARPASSEPDGWWFRRLSPSLKASLSTAGMVVKNSGKQDRN